MDCPPQGRGLGGNRGRIETKLLSVKPPSGNSSVEVEIEEKKNDQRGFKPTDTSDYEALEKIIPHLNKVIHQIKLGT